MPLKVAYLTAGAAGMICGSCLHDNTLARAMIELGHDVQLVPLYTPIRTDEQDVTSRHIFYGGINLYLQQKLPLFRWLPKWADRWLDQPWLIEWAAGRSVKIEPKQVADLALSILRGHDGNQRKEIDRLAEWLTGDLRPDVVVFSNILTAGAISEIKRRMNLPVVVTLQGDDIFLRELPEPQRTQCLAEIRSLSHEIDGFIANTQFYADYMAQYLGIVREKIDVVPLGIDVRDFAALAGGGRQPPGIAPSSRDRPPTIGYLARLAPEKGLQVLVDAFLQIKQLPSLKHARLKVAGWLGANHRAYAEGVFAKLYQADLGADFEYLGEVDRQGKLSLLGSIDVLSVPTTYREPKGLFVLEALAAGVPVVMPDHGAFPEVLAQTQGGLLHRPDDALHLAERLAELLTNPMLAQELGRSGRQAVLASRNQTVMAQRTAEVLERVVQRHQALACQTVSAVERA